MADTVRTVNMNDIEAGDVVGKIVNVYDTYANALAHAATGLQVVKEVDQLTEAVGSAITQTARTAGPTVDNNGRLNFACDDALVEIYLMCQAGRMGGPLRVDLS